MKPSVIYEDEQLFVINKPAGWITNAAATTTGQPVVEKWIAENYNFPVFVNPQLRHGIVHRLDKETSGVLVVAKTALAFQKLQLEFKSRQVNKTYLALLHGKVEPPEGEIKTEVGRLPWRRDRFGVVAGGRESHSFYKVLKFYPGNNAGLSLVEFYPKTGRTHQIRIHARFIGHAIVADEFYAGRKTARNDRTWCPRLFLHAKAITLKHPGTAKTVEFKSDLPQDLVAVLNNLDNKYGN